jgi:exodeoxyribonuclease VII small subunit
MKKNKTYSQAYSQLMELVKLIESEHLPIDELVVKIKEANELIDYCQSLLKQMEEG